MYERQSIPVLIELLTKSYLIDVRQLDTRLLSSSESEHMHIFFRYVAQCMNNAYENRWRLIKQWLGLSLNPKEIEFNLLGFARWNKVDRVNTWKTIEVFNRSSYISCESALYDLEKNLVVVFEATTAKMSFTTDVLHNLTNINQSYPNSIKILLRKLGQLERQIFYLRYYYNIGIHQFFGGLIFFELYRTPSINPNELLKNIINLEIVRQYFPILAELFDIGQLIFTY